MKLRGITPLKACMLQSLMLLRKDHRLAVLIPLIAPLWLLMFFLNIILVLSMMSKTRRW